MPGNIRENIIKIYILHPKAKFHSALEWSVLWIAYISIVLHGYGSSCNRYTFVLKAY